MRVLMPGGFPKLAPFIGSESAKTLASGESPLLNETLNFEP
jgi:hypothetical protein